MIAVVTHKQDITADYIITGLQQKRLSYRRINTEDLSGECEGSIEITSSGIQSSLWKDVSAVLFRRTKVPDYNVEDSGTRRFLDQQARAYLDNLWSLSSGRWVSHPHYVYRAENKLLQLKTAVEVGLDIPRTLVSSDSNRIASFWQEENGQLCVKPLKNVRLSSEAGSLHLYTSRVSAEDLRSLAECEPSPAIYQREIKKEYELRVTVVGDQCFTARVDSQTDASTELDWRRGKTVFVQHKLEAEMSERCVALTKRLGLSYGAIDMAVTVSGDHYFFEINPVGQFAWIEFQTGQPITNALIDLLKS